jgi:hypothetical protein
MTPKFHHVLDLLLHLGSFRSVLALKEFIIRDCLLEILKEVTAAGL